ncbi:hypothetical protein MOSE0_J09912 [Monosporozyma servazzii]
MDPSNPEKETAKDEHSLSSPDLSEDSKDYESHPQKELNETTMNNPPKTFSMEDNGKKLASIHKNIYCVDSATIGFLLAIFFLSILSIFVLWVPKKVMGTRFCFFLLISHSLSFLGFAIIHYHFLPPLLDESNILGGQINEGAFTTQHIIHLKMKCFAIA